jgi:GntR family L-lactate dehydrogenase operon transcriptional regulator
MVMARRSQAFFRTLNTQDEEKLIQVLEARRALERETARLAALRVSEADVDELERTLESQRLALAHGEPGTYQNLAFHEAITRFARNEVIAHALYLVRNQSELSLLLSLIRQQVEGVMIRDHQEIVYALRARDPNRAEQAMVRHMDRIIADVHRYFDRRMHQNGEL